MGFFDDLFGGGAPEIRDLSISNQQWADWKNLNDEAIGSLRQQQGVLDQGYQRALQTAAGTGAANAQLIQDSAQQGIGSLLGRLGGSGLSNSSVGQNLGRGILADQNRSLLQNNTNVAGLLSGLHVGRGEAQAGALSSLAQGLTGRARNSQRFTLDRYGLQLRRDEAQAGVDAENSAGLGSLLGAAGKVGLGFLVGGPAGAAAGAGIRL